MRDSFLAFTVLVSCQAFSNELYSITQDGRFFQFNDANGVRTLLDDFNFTNISGLAFNTVDSRFYFADNNNLYSFPLGGQPVLKRNLGFVTGIMGDIAIDRSGVVWGIESSATFKLWRFGTISGETAIASYLTTPALNMDFGNDGSLYAWLNDAVPSIMGTYVINQQTGALTKIASGASANGEIFAIPSTEAYGAYLLNFNGPQLNRLAMDAGTTAFQANVIATPVRGAAYMTPKPFTAATTLGNVNFGRIDSNPSGCLTDRDGILFRICKFIVPNQTVPPIQFELNVNGPPGQSFFGYFFQGRMTVSGALTCRIEAKRLSDGGFTVLDQRGLGNTGQTYFKNCGSLTPYFNANGDATMRVVVQLAGPISSPTFCLEIDQLAIGMD